MRDLLPCLPTLTKRLWHGRLVWLLHSSPAGPPALPAAQPDPTLRTLLRSIPLPKFVFTNADRAHAARCLELLGITDCFERVIAFEDVMEAAEQVRGPGMFVSCRRGSHLPRMLCAGALLCVPSCRGTSLQLEASLGCRRRPTDAALQAGLTHHGCPVVCKPNRQAFDIALKLAGSPEPAATLWADDSARNITTGHRMGLYSVLVGRTGGRRQPVAPTCRLGSTV